MNPFAVRSLKRPGCVDHAFSPHSSSRTASGSGGLIMMNDTFKDVAIADFYIFV